MAEHIALPRIFNALIAGQSQSGKTFFVRNLLLNADMAFKKKPDIVIYLYRHEQPAYMDIKALWKDKIIFISEVPTEEDLKQMFEKYTQGKKNTDFLFIADDYMDQICTNKLFSDLLTRIGHHYSLSNIFIVQDASLSGPMKRELLSNIHINVFMANSRGRAAIRNLGIQLNDYHAITSAFDYISSKGRGNYLLIDTHPSSDPSLKYRTNVFPGENPGPMIFKSKKYDQNP